MGSSKQSYSKFTVGCFTFIIIALMIISISISPFPPIAETSNTSKPAFSPTDFSQRWNSSWSLDLNTDIESNLVLADIVGGSPLELVIGCKNGSIFLFDSNGNLLPGWPVQAANFLSSTATIVNLDGTGSLEILVGGSDGKIYAWNSTGSLVSGFPVQLDAPIEGTIAAGDIMDDSLPEIVVGTESGKVYVVHSNGTTATGWPVQTGTRIVSSPALGDLDGDGDVEVVVGSDDKLYALNPTGTSLFGFPVTLGGDLRSSPALGDLNADGDLEIVISSTNGFVYAIQYTSFALAGWPKSTSDFLIASVALADVNLDGFLEVIVGDDGGDMYVWNYQGTALSGWPKGLPGSIEQSAIVANIHGHEEPEIIVGTDANETYVWYQNGTVVESWPKTLNEPMVPTPVVGDLFGNNTVALVTLSNAGNLTVWFANLPLRADTLQWPQFQQNPAHTGLQKNMVEGSLLLDKETYQPGDNIYASGDFQYTNGTGIADANAEFRVYFPNGTLWVTITEKTDSVGEVEHQFQLEPIYPEGSYTVELKANKTGAGIIWKQQVFSLVGPDQAYIVVRANTNTSEPLVGTHINVTFTVHNVGNFNATSTQVNITLSSKLDTSDPLDYSLGEIGNKSHTTFSITVTPNALSVASINATSTWDNETGSTHYGPDLYEYSILTLPS
ncbi:MAG: FG-GAP-like repeat-containing protein, partial [Candidatus Ranarchaeia archaeon]